MLNQKRTDKQRRTDMKNKLKTTPIDLVTNTETLAKAFLVQHKALTSDIKDKNQFESLIPQIVTPEFVGLFGNSIKSIAVKDIQNYVESLIPTHEVPVTEKVVEDGKVITRDVIDPETNKVKTRVVPRFTLTKGYEKVARQVEDSFDTTSVYWDARLFVEKNIPTIDEKMFDKMNDYLWRHIMAVVYPDDVKREFKHLCINIKRKLYYLGDRDKVNNQTLFGLYDFNGGGGKTTLLEAFTYAFSDDNPVIIHDMEAYFKFNEESADKYGVGFYDEDSKCGSVKDKLKQTVDATLRRVEGKGKTAHTINNLITLVVAANHKISQHLFEDEARGQRRDATFEAIGNLIQFTTTDMKRWFAKMFEVCPIDDDSRTYKHHNPHSKEIQDGEYTILAKLADSFNIQDTPYKLGQLADKLEIKSKSPQWYDLKNLLKLKQYFDVRQAHDRSKFYQVKMDEVKKTVGCATTPDSSWWSMEWRNTRPFIDIELTLDALKNNDKYDCDSPITYDSYKQTSNNGGTSNESNNL